MTSSARRSSLPTAEEVGDTTRHSTGVRRRLEVQNDALRSRWDLPTASEHSVTTSWNPTDREWRLLAPSRHGRSPAGVSLPRTKQSGARSLRPSVVGISTGSLGNEAQHISNFIESLSTDLCAMQTFFLVTWRSRRVVNVSWSSARCELVFVAVGPSIRQAATGETNCMPANASRAGVSDGLAAGLVRTSHVARALRPRRQHFGSFRRRWRRRTSSRFSARNDHSPVSPRGRSWRGYIAGRSHSPPDACCPVRRPSLAAAERFSINREQCISLTHFPGRRTVL